MCEYERIGLRNIRHKEAFFAELASKEAKEARVKCPEDAQKVSKKSARQRARATKEREAT